MQYLVYGTMQNTHYHRKPLPAPVAFVMDYREEAVTKIAVTFYELFKETLKACDMSVPSDPEELCHFLLGESDSNDIPFIQGNAGFGFQYSDVAFREAHKDAGSDPGNARTWILEIVELYPDVCQIDEVINFTLKELLDAIIIIARTKQIIKGTRAERVARMQSSGGLTPSSCE